MAQQALVLDTNIISETLKAEPNHKVLAWLLQNQKNLYLNAVTVGELWEGAYRLPTGKRRENLLLALERITSSYQGRILPYDGKAAQTYAFMKDETRRQGKMLTVEDGMIATICATEKATLATRNIKDFKHLGIELVNPFEAATPDVAEVEF